MLMQQYTCSAPQCSEMVEIFSLTFTCILLAWIQIPPEPPVSPLQEPSQPFPTCLCVKTHQRQPEYVHKNVYLSNFMKLICYLEPFTVQSASIYLIIFKLILYQALNDLYRPTVMETNIRPLFSSICCSF